MKKLGIAAGGVVLFLAVFWIGLMLTFPGAAVSRFLESQFNRYPGLALSLSPATLRWNGLELAEAAVRTTRGRQPVTVLTLRDVTIPLPGPVFSGLNLRARVGESGRALLFFPWNVEQQVTIDGALQLEELGVSEMLPARFSGRVTMQGNLMPAALVKSRRVIVPPGSLTLEGSDVAVEGLVVLGQPLPPARFDAVKLVLDSGRNIDLRALTFSGDLNGRITGSLTPDLQNVARTRLNFQINTAFEDRWLAGLGPMRVMAESFLVEGKIEGRLSGTVAQPSFRPTGRRGAAVEAQDTPRGLRRSQGRRTAALRHNDAPAAMARTVGTTAKSQGVNGGTAAAEPLAVLTPTVQNQSIAANGTAPRLSKEERKLKRQEQLAARQADPEQRARREAQREERRKQREAARASRAAQTRN